MFSSIYSFFATIGTESTSPKTEIGIVNSISQWISNIDYLDQKISPEVIRIITLSVATIILLIFLFVAQKLLRMGLKKLLSGFSIRIKNKWLVEANNTNLPSRISHLFTAIFLAQIYPALFYGQPIILQFFETFSSIYALVSIILSIVACFTVFREMLKLNPKLEGIPINGFFQAINLILYLIGGILILSILLNKSPVYFLSGLGALTAVLLLVFRDTLLGFTAGIMISANRIISVGDWIEIPKHNADGKVLDVSLTTVKVQNWDNTISAIPAYSLISESFKNWRGMKESGGRRIKRSIFIDIQSIHFANESEIHQWQEINLIENYLSEKLNEINTDNQNRRKEINDNKIVNERRITNIGTFRAYCLAYLKANKNIHDKMTLMVRQLDPTEFGVPLEIYAFANDTNWISYENIQSDIFDHLISILTEFNLSVFQSPSGNNFEAILKRPPINL